MKDRTKGFLAGVACTALTLSLAATAFAAAGSVSFNSVNLRFNGQQISAKGENYTIGTGASVPASILYTDENGGGTTYLPIARISELLGTEIGWDGSTGSVRIGEDPSTSTNIITEQKNVSIGYVSYNNKLYELGINSPDDNLHSSIQMQLIDGELFFVLSEEDAFTDTTMLIGLMTDYVIRQSDNPYVDGKYCCRAIYKGDIQGLSWKQQQKHTSISAPIVITTMTYNGQSISTGQFDEAKTTQAVTIDGIRFCNGYANVNDTLKYFRINKVVTYEYDNINQVDMMKIQLL